MGGAGVNDPTAVPGSAVDRAARVLVALAFRAALWLLPMLPGLALAQHASELGTSTSGLRGLVVTGLPLPQRELALTAAAGYGFTEPFEPVEGAHHRVQGGLSAAVAPLPWLACALRLDGRLELHPDDGRGADSTGFGDPRLLVRAGHALAPDLSIGLEAGLWFPGTDAPSFEPSATSVDARALLAFTPEGPWVALGALGFRLDQSANSAPDVMRLRLGDRISLGLSDSNALLVALGLARRLGDEAELFGELSGDLLVGSDAPELLQSPLRAALGGRYFVSRAVQTELTATIGLSKRPPVTADDPLVPIEPRLTVVAAVRYALPLEPAPKDAAAPRPPAPAPPPARTAPPQLAAVAGSLVDERGYPLPEVKVLLRASRGPLRGTITDAAGRYRFEGVPVGPAELTAEATGYETQRWTIEVQAGMSPERSRPLSARTDVGVLRGLVRSFDSAPLRARILARDRRGRTTEAESAEDGRFELTIAPGRYRVTISAPGYRSQSREVVVEPNGVAILNLDMREQK